MLTTSPGPRPQGQGGGVGQLYRSLYTVQQSRLTTNTNTFGYLAVAVKGRYLLQLVIVYRPPPSKNNLGGQATFLNEFHEFIAETPLLPGDLVVVGF